MTRWQRTGLLMFVGAAAFDPMNVHQEIIGLLCAVTGAALFLYPRDVAKEDAS